MLKKSKALLLFLLLFFLVSCSNNVDKSKVKRVGLLVPQTVSDQVWGTLGYKGMLKIQSQFDADIFYKEGMTSQLAIEQSVDEFDKKGVTLIFGHGREFSDSFNKLAPKYPHIHFISFNGDAVEKNTTSLKIESYASGFFGGMTAAHVSKSDKLGIVAAHKWQPEIKGYVEGAHFEKPNAKVYIEYTDDWDDKEKALDLLDQLIKEKVDVVYPAGDAFNVPVIEKLKEEGLTAIGYVSDQSDLGQTTVLTSTVQHVDKLYEIAAEKYAKGELPSGNLHFDFQDGAISMGTYSPLVKKSFQKKIQNYVEIYIETGKLPKS